jgi:hypothetical protein
MLEESLKQFRNDLMNQDMLHCRGIRRLTSTQVDIRKCSMCVLALKSDDKKELLGNFCENSNCNAGVCSTCFYWGFSTRCRKNENTIFYKCFRCTQTFASFPLIF